MRYDLCVGITAFNSAAFLEASLRSIRETAAGLRIQLEVVDNESSDDSAAVAREAGATVTVSKCTQADALNRLLDRSRAPYTLLIHADVVLIGGDWFDVCRRHITDTCALVSPQDIGFGPYIRTHNVPDGADKPESSFLFFSTRGARRAREWFTAQRFRVRWPRRALDFFGPHVTHRLPEKLARSGMSWHPMRVHTSSRAPEPYWALPCEYDSPISFVPEYATYRYGFGNFYSLDGAITHYHNWYNRVDSNVPLDSPTLHQPDLVPLAFVRSYSERFLEDYYHGRVHLPSIDGDAFGPPAPGELLPRRGSPT